jgi:hypothetical protein
LSVHTTPQKPQDARCLKPQCCLWLTCWWSD